MSKIGIFFGTSTGTTESVAQQIAEQFGVEDVFNVGEVAADKLSEYDVLLLGSSTWGSGDLQDDWYDFLEAAKDLDLSGKKVAIFGCGDSSSFSDTFCGAMGTIYNDLQGTGCEFIGAVSTDGYTYDDSEAVVDGNFVGLAIDDVNEDDKTPERIQAWVEAIKGEL